MADQGTLFEAEHTYGVGELNARITGALSGAFPGEIWVRGEVQGLGAPNRSGHVYFSLHEKGRGRAPATIGVALFAKNRERIDRQLADHPGFSLAEGLEIRVRGKIDYWPPSGRVQLVVSAIDPLHTLGTLAAARERVLRALAADGLLDANRRLPVPLLPLHVGLVASDGSAGCTDFLHELEASALGWRVTLADTRVQGAGAENALLRALTALERIGPDVICVVRGGGARTDLVAFDSERIARRIAGLTIPVLTGIGHEIDDSVADAVAHTSLKTPTACAAALVDLARAFGARADGAWAAVARRAATLVGGAERRLADDARKVVAATRATVRVETQAATAATDRLHRCAGAALTRAGGRLERDVGRVESATLARLASHERRLTDARRRVRLGAPRALETAERRTDIAAIRVDAVDPVRAMRRGWTMTATPDGRLVRRAADLAAGATIVTTFADGTATSRVESVAPVPEPEPTDD